MSKNQNRSKTVNIISIISIFDRYWPANMSIPNQYEMKRCFKIHSIWSQRFDLKWLCIHMCALVHAPSARGAPLTYVSPLHYHIRVTRDAGIFRISGIFHISRNHIRVTRDAGIFLISGIFYLSTITFAWHLTPEYFSSPQYFTSCGRTAPHRHCNYWR